MNNNYVRNFVGDAIKYAADTYRNPPSPLLADAYNRETKEHYHADFGKQLQCKDIVFSNLAHQMNFIRTLYALYKLDGDKRYEEIIKDNFNYYFEHHQYPAGLIEWGGHRLIDLRTLEAVGEPGPVHELKSDYPAYRIMHGVNSAHTLKYMEAFWNAHVFNWETLEISRHGDYKKEIGKLWDSTFADTDPFIEVLGLSFINAGNDLVFSATEYYKLTGDKRALLWAKRLVNMYIKARNATTGLGVYQFNQPKQRDTTDNFAITTSNYGDRAKRQLGPELGANALEGNVLIGSKTPMIYGYNILLLLHEAQTTKAAPEFINYCQSGLEAFAKYAYVPSENMFKPLLADGQDLTGFVTQRDGYYGKKGTVFNKYPATGLFFLSFSKAALLSGSESLWSVSAGMADAFGFGNIGSKPGEGVALNNDASSTCPMCLFAFLNLYMLTGENEYLRMAEIIADNISHGTDNSSFVQLSALEPLAVICYESVKNGKSDTCDWGIYL